MKPKIIFFVAEDWFFRSHFEERALAGLAAGYEVCLLTRPSGLSSAIEKNGVRVIEFDVDRSGLNPLRDVQSIRKIAKIYTVEKPSIVHHVAMKPIIYGTIAARLARVPAVVNAPVGTGFVFSSKSLKARALRLPLSFALRRTLNPPNSRVIFENPHHLDMAVQNGSVRAQDARLIMGAGVDVGLFQPAHLRTAEPLTVVLTARMLWEKGVGTYVEAARIISRTGRNVRFLLVGGADRSNPSAISESQLKAWHEEGIVEWLGRRDDVVSILRSADVFCLPSAYGEGLPKSILEGMASGLPVITTDIPGCKDAVIDGVNGFIIPPSDPQALARAVSKLADDAHLRSAMGGESRRRAVEHFSSEEVISQTLGVWEELGLQA